MKKRMKLGRLEDWLKGELQDASIRKGYGKEKRSIFLAHRILTLREKLKLSQKQVAARMGTSQQAVARLESGGYEGFTVRTLEKVAAALGAELVIDLRKPLRKSAV